MFTHKQKIKKDMHVHSVGLYQMLTNSGKPLPPQNHLTTISSIGFFFF